MWTVSMESGRSKVTGRGHIKGPDGAEKEAREAAGGGRGRDFIRREEGGEETRRGEARGRRGMGQ